MTAADFDTARLAEATARLRAAAELVDHLAPLRRVIIDADEELRATMLPGRRRRPGAADPADHALGRSRGGLTTKIRLACDGHGRPLSVLVTASNVNDDRARKAIDYRLFRPRLSRTTKPHHGYLLGGVLAVQALLEELTRHHHALDLVGPLVDLGDLFAGSRPPGKRPRSSS
ncbi:hypothetical protein Hesp01_65090 [Herbidospora sp. NBRC 101105]|nr:hypothetical protein Hesp01_65090 [Herbidospora sp. NBRC 101105]